MQIRFGFSDNLLDRRGRYSYGAAEHRHHSRRKASANSSNETVNAVSQAETMAGAAIGRITNRIVAR